ncbi:conserved hypothetical protein [Xenorhabdus nematophila str. Websteri]|nr:conserved hypothetical protein [Xenorhabdus nematophila str. Websteri]
MKGKYPVIGIPHHLCPTMNMRVADFIKSFIYYMMQVDTNTGDRIEPCGHPRTLRDVSLSTMTSAVINTSINLRKRRSDIFCRSIFINSS